MIDLGGVHRLADQALAEKWYGLAPGAWSYGLPEVHPAEGPLIANPGLLRDGDAARALAARGMRPKATSSSTRSRA